MLKIKKMLQSIKTFKGISHYFPKEELSFTERRLVKALKENAGSYTINKDGFVSLDLSNPKVIEKIAEQVRKCSNIKVERA